MKSREVFELQIMYIQMEILNEGKVLNTSNNIIKGV